MDDVSLDILKEEAAGEKPVILFDGVCNLCTGSVRFILKRDPGRRFRFSSIQSQKGGELYRSCGLDPEAIETFVLIEGDRFYTKSDAALRIARKLSGLWPVLGVLLFLPKAIRDFGYDVIASNRYRWFGKEDVCMVPPDDVSDRFIE